MRLPAPLLRVGLNVHRQPLEREVHPHLPALVQARVEGVAPHRLGPLVRVPRDEDVQRVLLPRDRRDRRVTGA